MLVAYDIADDRRRDRVAVALQEHGDRVQYSVFLVDGRPATFVRLQGALERMIEPATDALLFCDLGSRDNASRAITQIGRRRRVFTDDETRIL
jgi:CRISPR-associated protein Cas2